MKVAITVEGQRGLTWPRWQRLVRAVEALGFAGLYRSDHFLDAAPPDRDSLELWSSLTWLAANTRRIEFGPLVTPLSFRHPVHTARIAKDVDTLSEGRLVLGLGAGWEGGQREHEVFGFELLDANDRFARFEEGIQVITRLLHQNAPQTFDGRFYHLKNARLLPRPHNGKGPPILIGGNGLRRTLALVARYADEWNAIFRTPEQFSVLNRRLDHLLDETGRAREAVARSQMVGLVFGLNQQDLQNRLQGRSIDALQARGFIAGTASQIVAQLGRLEAAGVQKIMLQWLHVDDIDRLEAFANTILPQVQPKST